VTSKAERQELLASDRRRRHEERRARETASAGLARWLAEQVDADEAWARDWLSLPADYHAHAERMLRESAFKRALLIADLPEWVAAEMARVYEDRPGYAGWDATMKTRTQIDVAGDYQMATWNAAGGQEQCWATLREQAGPIAAKLGLVLDDGEADERSVLYMRILARNGFDSVSSECAAGEAAFVRLRLSCWGEPQ
jgi:hypothetical protein